MRNALSASLLAALTLAACATSTPRPGGLRIASWNLEHFTEANNSGCRPRSDADYAALKAYAQKLDADVIAFQVVESVGVAQRVFDSAAYEIFMETRTGTPNCRPPCNGKPEHHLKTFHAGRAHRK